MKSRGHFTPYYYLLAGVLLQGLSPVFTKLLLPDLSYATVVAARYLLAVGFLLPFGYHHRTVPQAPGKPTRRDWVALFFVGALGSGLGALLLTAALDYSHAGIVNAISKTAPIFVAFFAYLTLRERITWGRVMLVLMMVVADVLIGVGELSLGTAAARQYLIGDALALAAGVTRAIAEILGKGALRKFAPATVALWRFGIGCLITGTIALGTGEWAGLLQLGTNGWIILLVLAGVSTSLSMSLYYRGLAEIPAHVAVTLKLLGAIVTVVVSWIVLNEALNAYHIAGMAVLVFGAYLIVMRTASQ
ncbi:MAG: DMT family transporter, partial [Armatimonadota bacterium]